VRSISTTCVEHQHFYKKGKREGFIKLDRRKGAIISIDVDKLRVLEGMKRDISVAVARGICNGVAREEAHAIIDDLYDDLTRY